MTGTSKYTTLPCIVCLKDLQPVWRGLEGNQPNDGTMWKSSGNYGSSLYDRLDSSPYLEINICDECLRSRSLLGVVNEIHVLRGSVSYKENTWSPDDGAEGTE